MVHGRHHRHPQRGDVEKSRPQALVVVHDVEVVEPIGEQSGHPLAERLRFGEPGRPRGQQLLEIDARLDLAGPGDAERIGLAIEIEAGHLGEAHTRVHTIGIRLTREQFDLVAEFDQAAAQVAYVDALPATVCLAPVGQQGDAHRQITYPAGCI